MSGKTANLFLSALIVSMVGNVCADYAVMWHGITEFKNAPHSQMPGTLMAYYVAQAAGVILLSPVLASLTDRNKRLGTAIAIDIAYAASLATAAGLYWCGWFTAVAVAFFSLVTAALGILHKSSVAFAAAQKISERVGLTDTMSRFTMALNTPFLVGSVLSGLAFEYLGFVGCMAIGIATFLPMPFVYWMIFSNDLPADPPKPKVGFFRGITQGLALLRHDSLLGGVALSVAILNVVSAVMPGVVGLVFADRFPERTDYAAYAISVSIFGGILLTKPIGKLAATWPIKLVVPLSVLPAAVLLLACMRYPDPILISLVFLFSCIGSAARTVTSGSLRVVRIPKESIGTVNTAYSVILYLGQSVGGFVVLYAISISVKAAVFLILGLFALASTVSVVLLPAQTLSRLAGSRP